MENLRNVYVDEANELLANLEAALLALEESPGDRFQVEQIFRVMHTLKGNSGMFGFVAISDFVHDLETIYDQVRTGERPLEKKLLDNMFTALDHLKIIIHDPELKDAANRNKHDKLKQTMCALFMHEQPEKKQEEKAPEYIGGKKTYHIFFEPFSEFFIDGSNPLLLVDELASMGKCKAVPHFHEGMMSDGYDAAQCYCYWDIFLETVRPLREIADIFIFTEDRAVVRIEEIPFEGLLMNPDFNAKISAGIYKDIKISREEILPFAESLSSPGQLAAGEAVHAGQEQGEMKARSIEKISSSIRVSSDKLDELMNLVSELVTTQAGLSLYTENNKIIELEAITENVVKLSRRLRDIAFGMTLVPINNMFGRFQRMVRDIAGQLGKEVEFVTEGGETELDKTIIETFTDPLMHILRNSLDHGIEKADERIKLGKPAKGRVLLKAYYTGTFVCIQVTDDGKGIDPDAVRRKAIQKGIIRADENLSEEELFNLIFYPGFSTAEEVTDVSGRGVGMDVVKRNILDLKGTVHIQSRLHEGTTLTIRLPLTLSIIDGLLVSVNDIKYILPLSVVIKCYEVDNKCMVGNFNRLLLLDDERVPFINLREMFGYESVPGLSQVIVVNNGETKVGISVDFIVGEYQAVIKPLGRYYRHQDFVSGATILGDGTIALVLDIQKIIQLCCNNPAKQWQPQ